MPPLDMNTLINWIGSGIIGLFFGALGMWISHRLERNRDDISWEREKEKLQDEFEHEKELLKLEFQQKLKEMKEQSSEQESVRIREEILKGSDNPNKAIKELLELMQWLKPGIGVNRRTQIILTVVLIVEVLFLILRR